MFAIYFFLRGMIFFVFPRMLSPSSPHTNLPGGESEALTLTELLLLIFFFRRILVS